jgi:hypothetical protein
MSHSLFFGHDIVRVIMLLVMSGFNHDDCQRVLEELELPECPHSRSVRSSSRAKVRCIGMSGLKYGSQMETISRPGATELLCEPSFRKSSNPPGFRMKVGSRRGTIEARALRGSSPPLRIAFPSAMPGNEEVDLNAAFRRTASVARTAPHVG